MFHVAHLEALPASAATSPANATMHLVTALTSIERLATRGLEKVEKKTASQHTPLLGKFTWNSAIIAIRQLKLGHGRAAGMIIASLDATSSLLLERMLQAFALKVVLEEEDSEPERHSLLKRVYERGIIDGVAPRALVAALELDIGQIADLNVRRQVEVLMHAVYAGDQPAVARHASRLREPGAGATIRDLLKRHGLTIWDSVKCGPSVMMHATAP